MCMWVFRCVQSLWPCESLAFISSFSLTVILISQAASRNISRNRSRNERSMKFGRLQEHPIWSISSYRAIADLTPDPNYGHFPKWPTKKYMIINISSSSQLKLIILVLKHIFSIVDNVYFQTYILYLTSDPNYGHFRKWPTKNIWISII